MTITPLSNSLSNYEVTYAIHYLLYRSSYIRRYRYHENYSKGCEQMEKIKVLEWKPFFSGEVIEKNRTSVNWSKMAMVATITTAGLFIGLNAEQAMAAEIATNDFQTSLSQATQPIRDIITGFAHEIYFVFMSWGALEALIGKPQQGFTRMKIATASYVLLYWVPWIVTAVNKVVPQ